MTDRRTASRAKGVLRWVVVVAIFAFMGRRLASDWNQLSEEDIVVDPVLLLVSVVLLAMYMLGRALIWHYLTQLFDVAIDLRKSVSAWLWSQLGKYIPGKVFLFLGRLDFYQRAGKPVAPVAVAFGVELVGTFSASIATVLVGVATVDVPEMQRWRPLLWMGAVVLTVLLHPRVLQTVIQIVARILKRKSFEVTLTYGQLLRFVLLYTVNWMVFGAAFLVLVNSFTSLPADEFLFVTGAFSFASMVGMVAVFVPSGLGVREGILGFFLAQVISTPLALIAALVARIWFTVVELGMALASSVVLHEPIRSVRGLLERGEAGGG